ncbi:metallophosphoesterase [Comamonas flocculans]|uniref:Metallophosphoesterase n=1 Tax=Comamonas flocculans TaxID=2597701 RepID=A0A5B8RSX4_9BURK|nr:metallophosphoesterase [Comamonas flocculans]QEA12213.1 metallophosphoesterase [Comamonas flocculans]
MKIALLSDLHLSVHPMQPPPTEADVVVLAGDLQRPQQAMAWARQYSRPTVFVAGNHEFFGSDIGATYARLREHAAGSAVRVLEQDEWRHQGVRFLGCTLWSDFRLLQGDPGREQALQKITTFARDYTRIKVAPDFEDCFSPALSQLLFDQSVSWLERRFAESFDGPTVVVTHFAPAHGSIAARFEGSPINAAFVSDLQAQILRWQPALWLHGHVHDSFDYRIGTTRVVANPRGYARDGVNENQAFDPSLVLQI